MKPRRSKGAVLLAKLAKTQEQIASECGVSRALASYWSSGGRLPKLENRKVLLERYRIPIESWDEEPETSHTAKTKAPPDESDTWGPRTADAKASQLERMVNDLLTSVTTDATSTPVEKAKVMSALSVALVNIKKLRGETMDETRVLRLPQWKRIERILLETLATWPAAMRAVGEALRTLDEAT